MEYTLNHIKVITLGVGYSQVMTLDRFGQHIHHHEEQVDEIYLVKDVTDLRGDISKELRCATIITFSLHPNEEYFLKFNNANTFLRLFHTGRIITIVLEGWKTDMYYFLNKKMFTSLNDIYNEDISPNSCLQIRGVLSEAVMGYVIVEYSPWSESQTPFKEYARNCFTDSEAQILIEKSTTKT